MATALSRARTDKLIKDNGNKVLSTEMVYIHGLTKEDIKENIEETKDKGTE